MTEFSAKKLGEVMAFAEVGLETVERARNQVQAVIGVEETESLVFQFTTTLDELLATAKEYNLEEIAQKKASATAEKLRDMRDRYLTNEDDWQDPVEIAEWSGFFFGGAAVHFAVAEGIFDTLEKEELQRLSKAAEANMMELLMHIITYLRDCGSDGTETTE